MLITAEWLTARGACADQVRRFRAEWPEGTEVTEAAVARAFALGLDVHWFAQQFFVDSPSVWQTYKATEASAWQAFDRVAPSRQAYEAYCAVVAQALVKIAARMAGTR